MGGPCEADDWLSASRRDKAAGRRCVQSRRSPQETGRMGRPDGL